LTTYVFIHGGGLDGSIWKDVKALLEANNRVYTPTLSDEKTSSLSDHIAEGCSVIGNNELNDIILVGHSYGGMVITGMADRMPSRIEKMIYIDAAFPDPGQSMFDIFLSGGLDPLSFEGLNDYPPYTEKLNYSHAALVKISKIYIRCLNSSFIDAAKIVAEKIKLHLKEDNWRYLEIDSNHFPMISVPDQLVKML